MPEPLYDLSGKRVWVAGDRGMVGSAIARRLSSEPCQLIRASRAEVDLTRQEQVEAWMAKARPEAVFVAAAQVGGIHAKDTHPPQLLSAHLITEANALNPPRP